MTGDTQFSRVAGRGGGGERAPGAFQGLAEYSLAMRGNGSDGPPDGGEGAVVGNAVCLQAPVEEIYISKK